MKFYERIEKLRNGSMKYFFYAGKKEKSSLRNDLQKLFMGCHLTKKKVFFGLKNNVIAKFHKMPLDMICQGT